MKNGNYSQTTRYNRDDLHTDIVHVGFGAFHRGHQAVINDLTNDLSRDKWGIVEVNLFGSEDLIDGLNAQDGLYTVIEKSATETTSRLVRTVTGGVHTPVEGIEAAIELIVQPQVKIVSLTITEKGYCVDPQSGELDLNNALIKSDLNDPSKPASAIGLITESLRIRMEKGLSPISILSCDNIPENGHLTKSAILKFASQLDSNLTNWIRNNVTFPSTMVDRIVPAMTADQFEVIKQVTGVDDPVGVVCEDFRQWVIEDNFVAGRPDWDKAGAMFVSDVLPYEEMKLRMLNGSHSFLAYNGSLLGYEFIYQCMEDDTLRAVTLQLMIQEQARSLSADLNVDLEQYANRLIERFSNTNIKHKTGQIAMDGSQKLPQRALDPYLTLQQRSISAFCQPVLIAGWMHYILQIIAREEQLVDPLTELFQQIAKKPVCQESKARELLAVESIFGKQGIENEEFIEQVVNAFNDIESQGIKTVIKNLAKN